MSVSKKWLCPCDWRRSPGKCPKCGKSRKHDGWIADWSEDGKRKTKTFRTEIEAKRFLWNLGEETPDLVTFSELCDEFILLHASHNKDGGRMYKSHIACHLKPYFGDILLVKILPKHILGYLAQRRGANNPHGKPIKTSTLQSELKTLKALWHYARRQKYVEGDPFEGVRLPADQKQIKEVLTVEEEEKLFAAMKRHKTLPYFIFLAYTGARKMEALNLKWTDIDFENKIAWVKGKTRGQEEERQALYLDDGVIDVLEKMPRIAEHVFVDPKTKQPWRAPNNVLGPIAKKLGLKVRVHDLRHLFITRLVQGGANLRFVAGLARHANIAMTMRYAHFAPEDLRRALGARRNVFATKENVPSASSEDNEEKK